MKERRAALSPQERQSAKAQVEERLRGLFQQNSWPAIAVYLATKEELNLDGLIAWFLARAVPVFAPRGDNFVPLQTLGMVIINERGVREPRETGGESVFLPPKGVFLVPGLAFDEYGGRLGFGGGWYDRVLARFPQACKIGVAFDCQIVAHVPREEHDILMDYVVTPSRELKIANSK